MTAFEFPSIAWAYHLSYLLVVFVACFLVAAGLVVFARPFVRSIVEVMTEAPGEDVLGPCEEFDRSRVFREVTR